MIRFKKRGNLTVSGGVLYASKCGNWHLFRESPKTRDGRRLRQWWTVRRKPFGYADLVLGPQGETRFKSRQAAEEACRVAAGEITAARRKRRQRRAQSATTQQELFT